MGCLSNKTAYGDLQTRRVQPENMAAWPSDAGGQWPAGDPEYGTQGTPSPKRSRAASIAMEE
jgi:hypothetical protein